MSPGGAISEESKLGESVVRLSIVSSANPFQDVFIRYGIIRIMDKVSSLVS